MTEATSQVATKRQRTIIRDLVILGTRTQAEADNVMQQEDTDGDVNHFKKRKRENAWNDHPGRLEKCTNHTPVMVSSKFSDQRQRCVCCGQKSSMKCSECSAYLHCTEDPGPKSCWWRFHNLEDFKTA